jgi:hypothetical protein
MENEGYYAWEPTRSLEKSGTSLSIQLVDDVTGQRQIFKQLTAPGQTSDVVVGTPVLATATRVSSQATPDRPPSSKSLSSSSLPSKGPDLYNTNIASLGTTHVSTSSFTTAGTSSTVASSEPTDGAFSATSTPVASPSSLSAGAIIFGVTMGIALPFSLSGRPTGHIDLRQ